MRVLVLNHNMRERGTWFRARKVARGLWHRGHDVTFVCTGPGYYRPCLRSEEERWRAWESGSWVPFLSPDAGWSPVGLLHRVLKLRGRYDLIYTFSHKPVDQFTARLLRRAGTFWMTDWCDLWSASRGGLLDLRNAPRPLPAALTGFSGAVHRAVFRWDDRLEQAAARGADAVSIISTWMLSETRRLRVPDERVLHLVSGCDARIEPRDRASCRKALGLDPEATTLGYVANITEDNELLEGALERVFAKHPGLRLLSVGPRWYREGSFMGQLVSDGRARDFDRQPFARIPEFLGASDILLMPLRDTPFNNSRWPNKFNDYMAAGRATAGCDVADMGEVLRTHGCGVAGAPTAEGFAEAINALVEDEGLRQRCAKAALAAARGPFSWKSRIRVLCEFLESRGMPV